MPDGYLTLVLHAHLPFVRHPERADLLEERWLFEAISETYIPLLQVFHQLLHDGVDFRVTISLSPPLISMLTDSLLQSRFQNHMYNLISLAESEVVRTKNNSHLNALANEYLTRFRDILDFFESYQGNLLPAFAYLQRAGKVELITSAATHAVLPFIKTDEALRAQISTAVEVFQEHVGTSPSGMWLPECAYTPRVDRWVKEFGIHYFFTDSHGVASANPRPVFGTYAPVLTPEGIAVFARDTESSRQVWSSESGYPGDFDYREYYRDIGHDLDQAYICSYIHPNGIRVDTGIKYYRITGKTKDKALYHFNRARDKAALHAGHFLFHRQQQVENIKNIMGRVPVVTAPYDAELFGHWWYEGPVFIDMLLRKLHYDQTTLHTITPSEYLTLYQDFQSCELPMSTWGRDGYGDVWLNGANDWIYPALHDCEQQMIGLADTYSKPSPLIRRALNQAARELMLAQSSDWAFIMDTKTMVDYAVKRTKHHVNRFRTLTGMVRENRIDEAYLADLEHIDNLFPNVHYEHYQSLRSSHADIPNQGSPKLRILMLSWEFPPMTVGGLARHVYDLSRHLVQQGCEVHVVTTAIGNYPLDEMVEGVHVHRVQVLQPDGGEFIHFVLQLNLTMLDQCRTLIEEEGLSFDIIHAHDWLVCDVAKALKGLFRIPLIATIHATEHGRNHGIHTEVQRHIHQLEWELTYEAERVIVCSTYMKHELETVFTLPADKMDILPNGVDKHLLQVPKTDDVLNKAPYAKESEPIVLFLGRLVLEKGVHLLLLAAPAILEEFPDVKFVVVGKGPMLDHLQLQAQQLGITNRVEFAGFLDDNTRNRLLCMADVAVFPSLYEPFGIVALEAMAAKTPVIAADVGGLSDIVHHEYNGLTTLPNDVQSLSTQIRRLLRDREFGRELAHVAEQNLSHFDWRNIADKTIEIYDGILVPT